MQQLSLRKNTSNIFNLKTIPTNLTSIQERVQFKLLLRKDILNNKLHSKRLNTNNVNDNNVNTINIINNPTIYNFITNTYEYFNSLTNESLIINGLNYVYDYIINSYTHIHTHMNMNMQINIKTFQETFISCINSIIKTYINNENIMIIVIKILTSLCEYNLLSNNNINVNNDDIFEFTQEVFFTNTEYVSNYINMYSFYYELNEAISLLMLYFLGYCVQDSQTHEEILFTFGFIHRIIKEMNIQTDNNDVLHSKIWFISLLNTKHSIQLDSNLCIDLQKKLFDIILIDHQHNNNSNNNNINIFDNKNERFGQFIHNAITTLANLSDYSNDEFISNFISYEIIPHLITYKHSNQLYLEPIIKTIGNILSNPFERVKYIINEELINFFIFTLTYKHISNDIKNLSLWAMSNVIIDSENLNDTLFNKVMNLYIELLEESIVNNNYDIDCEITINLGALIGNTDDNDKRIEMIKKYNVCNVLKNFLAKYAIKIENNMQAKACYLAISIVYEMICFRKGNSGSIAEKIFQENGMMDLIERIIHLAIIRQRDVDGLDMKNNYFREIENLGEKFVDNNNNNINDDNNISI